MPYKRNVEPPVSPITERGRLDDILHEQEDDVSRLQGVITRRPEALHATQEELGIRVKNADPCHHCRAKLLVKTSKGTCRENGKYALPTMPPLPPVVTEMYTSNEIWARKFTKIPGRTTAAGALRP